jgi:Glutathione S-transferase, N-terminal domain
MIASGAQRVSRVGKGGYERRSMAIRLHRCSNLEAKNAGHPCWRVQNALDELAIEYEVVPGPVSAAERDVLYRLSGQRYYPVIEFDDGRVYREEALEMAERIRAGELSEMGLTSPAAGRPGPESATDGMSR